MPLDIRWKKSTFLIIFAVVVLVWTNRNITRTTARIGNCETKDSKIVHLNSTKHDNFYFNTKLPSPGVILHTSGGIGNQLFEYACAYALARDRNRTLYNFITTSTLGHHSLPFSPKNRQFALDKFEIPLNFIDRTTIIESSHVTHLDDRQLLLRNYSDNTFLQVTSTCYCQSEAYFFKYRHELKELFKLKREELDLEDEIASIAKQIERTSESVAIHMRRGDFLSEEKYYIPIAYQFKATHRISKLLAARRALSSPTFFVFSDDTVYAREKFESFADTFNYKFVFVSEATSTSIQDFYLMSKCKHFIIPNSTFSWWAAYLGGNRNKIVIASSFNPKFLADFKAGGRFENKFYLTMYGKQYHKKEWIVINPFVGEY